MDSRTNPIMSSLIIRPTLNIHCVFGQLIGLPTHPSFPSCDVSIHVLIAFFRMADDASLFIKPSFTQSHHSGASNVTCPLKKPDHVADFLLPSYTASPYAVSLLPSLV